MTLKSGWSFQGSSTARSGTRQRLTELLAQIGELGSILQKTTVRLWNVFLCIDAGIGSVWKGKFKKKKNITGKVVAGGVRLFLLPACVWCLPAPVDILGGAWLRVLGAQREGRNLIKKEKYSSSSDSICGRIRSGQKLLFWQIAWILGGKKPNRQVFCFVLPS